MELYTNKHVIAGFILSIATLFILGFYSYHNNQKFLQARVAIFHTSQVLYHIEQAKSNGIKIEELVSWFMVTRDSSFLQDYTEELKLAGVHFTTLKTLTADNESQQIRLDSLRSIGHRKLDIHQTFIKLYADTNLAGLSTIQVQNNKRISHELNLIIDGLLDEENFLLQQRIATSKIEMQRFQATFISLVAVILIILVIVFIVVNRALRGKTLAEHNTSLVNKELSAFTYSVSHDLRAPLRSILGFSQVLKEDYGQLLDSEGDRILDKVMRNARKMGQLIDDLLDFSRTGRKELRIALIDVQLQVKEVINELCESNPTRKESILVQTLQKMYGDINMMKQVWVNLISNALKYSQNVDTAQIEIGNTSQNGQTVFYVRDNGVGFDMQYYNKLFNVFQRLHSNSEFEGTGVGLALVHRIITRHQGKIWAESKPNEGATFYFSIPN
jgi:signal transduction histidine kinase